MNKELTIIQCVNDLNLSSGGPSKTVTSLSSYLSKRGLDVKICSSIPNSFDYLSEVELAAVITYTRQAWGNAENGDGEIVIPKDIVDYKEPKI